MWFGTITLEQVDALEDSGLFAVFKPEGWVLADWLVALRMHVLRRDQLITTAE